MSTPHHTDPGPEGGRRKRRFGRGPDPDQEPSPQTQGPPFTTMSTDQPAQRAETASAQPPAQGTGEMPSFTADWQQAAPQAPVTPAAQPTFVPPVAAPTPAPTAPTPTPVPPMPPAPESAPTPIPAPTPAPVGAPGPTPSPVQPSPAPQIPSPATSLSGSPVPPSTPAPGAPSGGPDWTDQVADLVVDTVDKVHDRTTGPLLTAAAGAVYGTVAALVGVVVLLIVGIIVSRLLSLIPGPVWIEYAGIGVLLVLGGALLWGRRLPKP